LKSSVKKHEKGEAAMQRLYYLTDSVSSVLGMSRDLAEAGIGDNRLHVMGRNSAVLDQARVHTTTFLEETDLMPLGFTGTLAGLAFGALFGFVLAIMDPWTLELGGSAVLVGAAFFACFGAWLGGIIGISRCNHHLKPYLAHVRAGHYLVMVDVDTEEQEKRVHQVIDGLHREAQEAGREDHFSPLF
jgi:hypothetical protein